LLEFSQVLFALKQAEKLQAKPTKRRVNSEHKPGFDFEFRQTAEPLHENMLD
jgi:hypothetical protein